LRVGCWCEGENAVAVDSDVVFLTEAVAAATKEEEEEEKEEEEK
jgi:hypothetical protein